MHDEGAAAGARNGGDEPLQLRLAILGVDADAALDRDGHEHATAHRRDAVGHQVGLRHQAGAEPALLHAVRRAADIEVDLVVAELFPDRGRLGEPDRIGAAKLQGDWVLLRAESE